MENNNPNSPITPESVLAAVKEMLAVSYENFNLQLKQSQEEQAKRSAEFDRLLKESRAEQEKINAEQAKRSAEFDRLLKESRAEQEKINAEQAKRSAALDLKLDRLTEEVSGITKSNGLYAEDYFFNSFNKDHTNFFGENFDKVVRGKGRIVQDEYDFVFINGKTAGIVEVKYKARKDDIAKALRKVNTFRENFPEYKNHKIYLGIAALSINETLERECNKQGIAVIKQVGDNVVVYDKNLKAF